MKTEIEVSKMKDDIENKISNLSNSRLNNQNSNADDMRICDQLMQLRAQYNILLEVLK